MQVWHIGVAKKILNLTQGPSHMFRKGDVLKFQLTVIISALVLNPYFLVVILGVSNLNCYNL